MLTGKLGKNLKKCEIPEEFKAFRVSETILKPVGAPKRRLKIGLGKIRMRFATTPSTRRIPMERTSKSLQLTQMTISAGEVTVFQ